MIQTMISDDLSQDKPPKKMIDSIGLNQFRLNPFRVLRLPVSVAPKQAVWQAEKVTSLSRIGLSPREPDPISWLSQTNEFEIQQAVQKVEEPLQRLVEQLFWFDFDADPKGTLLNQALLEADSGKLFSYLQITEPSVAFESLPPLPEKNLPEQTVSEPAELPTNIESDDGSSASELDATIAFLSVMAHQLNQANLRLLLALSSFYGVGPTITRDNQPAKAETRGSTRLRWNKASGIAFIMNPHEKLVGLSSAEDDTSTWSDLWSDALVLWQKILTNPYWGRYLSHLIKSLDDELIDEGVIETLQHAIPTRLADMCAGEIKGLINEGASRRVATLINVAATAKFDQQVWNMSFNSLRYFFQADLADLDELLSQSSTPDSDNITLYFKRLGQIKETWTALDPHGILGLQQLLDKAIINGFNVITSMSYAGDSLDGVKKLLIAAAATADAKSSMRERINSYLAQIKKLHKYETCHFCNKRERNPKYPMVLRGKKETGRDYGFNSTTIYYSIKPAIIPRCDNCADFHQFIHEVSIWFSVASFFCLIFSFFGLAFDFSVLEEAWFGVLVVGGIAFGIYFAIIKSLAKRVAAIILVSRGDRTFYQIHTNEGYKELISEGYNIERINLKKNALQELLAEAKKS